MGVVGAAFGAPRLDSALGFSIESTGSAWRHCCAVVDSLFILEARTERHQQPTEVGGAVLFLPEKFVAEIARS